jgi:hypothetical protein
MTKNESGPGWLYVGSWPISEVAALPSDVRSSG